MLLENNRITVDKRLNYYSSYGDLPDFETVLIRTHKLIKDLWFMKENWNML